MENPLIIVGIDPGTTTAFSIMDVDGNLLKTASYKNLGLSALISTIMPYGDIVLVGTDKKNCPKLIENFAVKTGARIVKPRQDILVSEKKELINKIKTRNSHEADSLASAIFAYKEFYPLFKKIDIFLKKNNKAYLSNKIKKIVLTKGLSIKDSLKLVEKPVEGKIVPVREIIKEKGVEEKISFLLNKKLKSLENANLMIRRQNAGLKKKLKRMQERQRILIKKAESLVPDKKARELLGFKEKRIISLDRELNEKDKKINELNDEIKNLNSMILNIENNVLAKKLDNLGYNEFLTKNNVLNIKKGNVLLVDNPNIFSEKTINALKNRVDAVVSKKKVNRGLRENLDFIDSTNLKITESRLFAIIDRKGFEREKGKVNLLAKVIQDYRKSRL